MWKMDSRDMIILSNLVGGHLDYKLSTTFSYRITSFGKGFGLEKNHVSFLLLL